MANYGPVNVTAPAGAIVINPGDDVSSIVASSPTGATFYFEPGVYRGLSLVPKDGQTFIGAPGAVLNGSEVVTSFTQQGSAWVIEGQAQEGIRHATGAADGTSMRAGYPETVFLDDAPLKPVDDLSKLTSGTFYFDYDADRIYLADDPAGHKVETGKLDRAFQGDASGVTVQNFVIEKYSPPTQGATVQGGEGWTIKDNEVRLNYALGIHSQDNAEISGNYVHDNGQMGIGGVGANILVEGNEIARNGYWSGIDVFWEGGGTKFALTNGLVVRDNFSHDNKGFGLWTDIDNVNALYEGNTVTGNSGGGINHEISYAAVIRDNVLTGNGFESQGDGWMWGGQIQIQNSSGVQVYGNRIDMTGAQEGNGIGLIQQDRGSGAFGAYTTTGNHIHDNVIVSQDGNGRVGGAADYNEAGMINGGNVWSNNAFYMPAGGDRFWWGNTNSFEEFKAATGETGTLSQDYPNVAEWVTEGSGTDGGQPEDPGPQPDPGAPGTMPCELNPDVVGRDQPLDPLDREPGSPSKQPDLLVTEPLSPEVSPATGRAATHGHDVLVFGAGSDTGRGQGGDDLLVGLEGHDTLSGGWGDDVIDGGSGGDRLRGGHGDDVIAGRAGNDALRGGWGDDVLDGGEGDDELRGGGGDDLLVAGSGSDRIDGGRGTDLMQLTGTIDDYTIAVDSTSVSFRHTGGDTDVATRIELFRFDGSGETYVLADGDLVLDAGSDGQSEDVDDAMMDRMIAADVDAGAVPASHATAIERAGHVGAHGADAMSVDPHPVHGDILMA